MLQRYLLDLTLLCQSLQFPLHALGASQKIIALRVHCKLLPEITHACLVCDSLAVFVLSADRSPVKCIYKRPHRLCVVLGAKLVSDVGAKALEFDL